MSNYNLQPNHKFLNRPQNLYNYVLERIYGSNLNAIIHNLVIASTNHGLMTCVSIEILGIPASVQFYILLFMYQEVLYLVPCIGYLISRNIFLYKFNVEFQCNSLVLKPTLEIFLKIVLQNSIKSFFLDDDYITFCNKIGMLTKCVYKKFAT